MSILDIIGVIGFIGYISSYALLQLKREFAKSILYSFLNLMSAVFVLLSLMQDFNLASVLIQVSWILISLFGIYRCLKYSYQETMSRAWTGKQPATHPKI